VDFDLAPIDQDLGRYSVLIYAGPDLCREEELIRLATWVDAGGNLIVMTTIPTRSVDGRDLSSLAARLRQHPRVLARPWGSVDTLLERLGAPVALRAEAAGLWTAAYEDDAGWTLFVSNVDSAPVTAAVRLGPELAKVVADRSGRDLLSGEEWKIRRGELWADPPLMAVSEVRCIRIAR